MKINLVSINAKYIHTNNAVRLLKANSSFPMEILEYTIKDDVKDIINEITTNQPDVLGFSVYIWNVEMILHILEQLHLPHTIVVLGGPEVSYDASHFLSIPNVDIVIRGEGELTFEHLLQNLQSNQPYHTLDGVATYYNDKLYINKITEIMDLNALEAPYYFEKDIHHIPHKIAYIESSRGCPYNCSYCLSSLEEKVRFFNIEKVQKAILYLQEKGAKTIKFLDRTFNANKHTLDLIQFIIDHNNHKTVFQFEITGDTLPIQIIDYINQNAPKGLFRFEIGIQSTNDTTNRLVDRYQDTDKLFKRIRMIQEGGIIDLHLDLIAGLPKEDKTSFINTFNSVFQLGAKELQLGFLKMLRGTKIRLQASLYGYVYHQQAPYEIISNDVLKEDDITEIKQVEHMLEIYHNKGYFGENLLSYILSEQSPYHFFLSLANHYQTNNYSLHRYQIEDVYKHLLELLDEDTKYTIYQDYLHRSKIKPHIFFDTHVTKEDKQQVFQQLSDQYNIPLQKLYKHSVLIGHNHEYFCAFYQDNSCTSYKAKAPK